MKAKKFLQPDNTALEYKTNDCMVAAAAIPAASAPLFPSVTSITESLSLTQNHSVRLLALLSVLRVGV